MKPFWKSTNFWTDVIVVIVAVIGYFLKIPDVAIPDVTDSITNLKDAIFMKDIAAIFIAAGKLANIIYHIFFKNQTTG